MSFAVQEQLLLALLFDRELRQAFSDNPADVLAQLGFSEAEKADFLAVRLDGLAFDADLRVDLILSQMTRHYPLSFALLSSLQGGIDRLPTLVDMDFIQTRPEQRAMQLGLHLRDALPGFSYASEHDRARTQAICEAELGMAITSADLRQSVNRPDAGAESLPADWLSLPVRLGAFVSAAVIPLPYAQLKQAFCPCEGTELWRRLHSAPLSAAQRQAVLARLDARLLLSRAYISQASACEPSVDYQTVELAQGFAPLFRHVDGGSSVGDILLQLRHNGAAADMLDSIGGRFRQLLEMGMLQLERV